MRGGDRDRERLYSETQTTERGVELKENGKGGREREIQFLSLYQQQFL